MIAWHRWARCESVVDDDGDDDDANDKNKPPKRFQWMQPTTTRALTRTQNHPLHRWWLDVGCRSLPLQRLLTSQSTDRAHAISHAAGYNVVSILFVCVVFMSVCSVFTYHSIPFHRCGRLTVVRNKQYIMQWIAANNFIFFFCVRLIFLFPKNRHQCIDLGICRATGGMWNYFE